MRMLIDAALGEKSCKESHYSSQNIPASAINADRNKPNEQTFSNYAA